MKKSDLSKLILKYQNDIFEFTQTNTFLSIDILKNNQSSLFHFHAPIEIQNALPQEYNCFKYVSTLEPFYEPKKAMTSKSFLSSYLLNLLSSPYTYENMSLTDKTHYTYLCQNKNLVELNDSLFIQYFVEGNSEYSRYLGVGAYEYTDYQRFLLETMIKYVDLSKDTQAYLFQIVIFNEEFNDFIDPIYEAGSSAEQFLIRYQTKKMRLSERKFQMMLKSDPYDERTYSIYTKFDTYYSLDDNQLQFIDKLILSAKMNRELSLKTTTHQKLKL